MNTHGRVVKVLFLFGFLLAVAAGCSPRREAPRSILPATCRLEAGDVVFRQGLGAISRAVRVADAGGVYSHVGIVVDSSGVKLVVHAVPGEPDREGDPDRVKADVPSRFFRSDRARAGAVMRPRDGMAGAAAAREAWRLYRRGVLFDHAYDDRDTNRMYCTELVNFAYRRAGRPLVDSALHRVNLPGLECLCVFPSDLLGSSALREVAVF